LERPRRMRHAKHNTTDRNEENTHSNTLTHTQTQPSPSFPTRQRSEGVSYRPGFTIIQGDEPCVPCAARGAAILSNTSDRTTRQVCPKHAHHCMPWIFLRLCVRVSRTIFWIGRFIKTSPETLETRGAAEIDDPLSLRPTRRAAFASRQKQNPCAGQPAGGVCVSM
jgi:hypothetical protein